MGLHSAAHRSAAATQRLMLQNHQARYGRCRIRALDSPCGSCTNVAVCMKSNASTPNTSTPGSLATRSKAARSFSVRNDGVDGSMYVMTPVDPLFVALPWLEKHRRKVSRQVYTALIYLGRRKKVWAFLRRPRIACTTRKLPLAACSHSKRCWSALKSFATPKVRA